MRPRTGILLQCVGLSLLFVEVYGQNCVDIQTWCSSYTNLCGSNNVVRLSCRKTCGICASGTASWGNWGFWLRCSLTCGGGTQVRLRVCSIPGQCSGSTSENRPCNEQACPPADCVDQSVSCTFPWAKDRCNEKAVRDYCPVSCNNCGTNTDTAKWGEWTGWDECTVKCGGGTQSRVRTCSQEGKCTGSSSDSRKCNEAACEVPRWGPWSSWSKCSKECGSGTRSRYRTCSVEGKCIEGDPSETETCNVQPCAVQEYSDWSGYGPCSVTCGGGIHSKTRYCLTGSCTKHLKEVKNCRMLKCPVVTSCSDLYDDCQQRKVWGGCNYQEASRICKKTCGLCDANCRDSSTFCTQAWAIQRCGVANIRDFCPLSCGKCNPNTGTGSGPGSEWSAYGPCNPACGVGMKTRKKGDVEQSITCINDDCGTGGTGRWSDWSAYGPCSESCGEGFKERTRTCSEQSGCDGSATQRETCEIKPCEGSWGSWSNWSPCSKTCGGADVVRNRPCNGPGQCSGKATETKKCAATSCPGVWSNWTPWQKCTATCGQGEQVRTRTCDKGLGQCSGNNNRETSPCELRPCPDYTNWSAYGACSDQCGGGVQSRTRSCNIDTCTEHLEEIRLCNSQQCTPSPGCIDEAGSSFCQSRASSGQCTLSHVSSKCKLTCGICSGSGPQWSAFGPCSVRCGVGIKTRTKGSIRQSITCIITGCDPNAGYWGDWSSYGSCTEACTHSRTRICSKPPTCPGKDIESKQCVDPPCKGTLGEWSIWGKCTVECGSGESQRTRTCTGPGKCDGKLMETRQCQTQPCPSKWSEWTDWSECTATCGGGDEKRTRSCSGALPCTGKAEETRKCNTEPCPGSWGEWTSWSDCSEKCGGGQQQRTRQCEGGSTCTGASQQTRVCNVDDCVEEGWLPWENWGQCDKPCGPGNRRRLRICIKDGGCTSDAEETEACTLRDCKTELTYSSCSRTCGDGIQTKLESDGEYRTQHCNLRNCPLVTCPVGSELRFKNFASCCKTVLASAPVCHWAAGRSLQTVRRIIGGQNSARGDWPWMAYMQTRYGVCGGALISSKFILTAAHCLQPDSGPKYSANEFTVILGYADLDKWDRKSHPVSRTIVHPDYSFPNHDIGLLELTNPITLFTEFVRPICLPHGEEVPNDATCIAMGWGVSVNGVRQVTRILQNVDLKVLDPNVCVHGYNERAGLQRFVNFLKSRRGYICAGDLKSAKDSCSGDSGSPLVCQRCDTCGWFVSGVVSFGPTPCAIVGAPGVYTKVTDYEQWIAHETKIPKEKLTCSK